MPLWRKYHDRLFRTVYILFPRVTKIYKIAKIYKFNYIFFITHANFRGNIKIDKICKFYTHYLYGTRFT